MPTMEEYLTRPVGDRVARLRSTPDEVARLLDGKDDRALSHRADARSWAPKEVVCHLRDVEELFLIRFQTILAVEDPPILTLSDKEYQRMRDAARRIIRRVGVETGGSNIQFAVNPANGRMVVIEMNPRVSRSSALASKATGFPIAKIAAKLAVGYLLDEIKNDITRETPASFEPTIDYVVTKVPRFAFEKFPQADPTLNTQMKSVGEAMAIGRTFKESLQKCLRSLEIGRSGLGGDGKPWRVGTEVYGDRDVLPREVISRKLSVPNAERVFFLRHALRAGFSIEEIFGLTKIDPWFLTQIKEIVDFEEELAATN